MKERIIGFDLARAYAIFGMYIVNFNFSFGSIMAPKDGAGRFLNMFTGNSTAIFIVCAGIGLSLMTSGKGNGPEEKKALRSKVLKRSWFLFALGLLLYTWWVGDILHFYGGYMHLAAFLLFVPKRYLLWAAMGAVFLFHVLLFIIPISTGWNFTDFSYTDFWTIPGFLRNTFYNGWNSIFPWMAYFLVGMWLGRLDWQKKQLRMAVFGTGALLFTAVEVLRFLVNLGLVDADWSAFIQAEYFPPYLPFFLLTMGFALMVIPFCIYIGERFSNNPVLLALQKTGQMTLTHYVIHLTLGMVLFAWLTGKHYTGLLEDETPTPALSILGFSVVFYLFSMCFSLLWSKKFKNGPLESLMRKISG